MPNASWICQSCCTEQTAEVLCETCNTPRYATWALMVQGDLTELIADGVIAPADAQAALIRMPRYARSIHALTLPYIARTMRLLTVDTTAMARAILKARAAALALEASAPGGERKDIIQVLKGIQVLGEVVEHKGEMVTRHVVELHEGPPPRKDES